MQTKINYFIAPISVYCWSKIA